MSPRCDSSLPERLDETANPPRSDASVQIAACVPATSFTVSVSAPERMTNWSPGSGAPTLPLNPVASGPWLRTAAGALDAADPETGRAAVVAAGANAAEPEAFVSVRPLATVDPGATLSEIVPFEFWPSRPMKMTDATSRILTLMPTAPMRHHRGNRRKRAIATIVGLPSRFSPGNHQHPPARFGNGERTTTGRGMFQWSIAVAQVRFWPMIAQALPLYSSHCSLTR